MLDRHVVDLGLPIDRWDLVHIMVALAQANPRNRPGMEALALALNVHKVCRDIETEDQRNAPELEALPEGDTSWL